MIVSRRVFILVLVLSALPGLIFSADPSRAQAQSPQFVSGPTMNILIRTTLVALNNANTTGNYTVLRDLGSVKFQAEHSTARLTDLFKIFRDQNVSLAATVLLDPVLSKPAELTTNGILQVEGFVPTRPQEVIFKMAFVYERERWRLASLNVGARDPASETTEPNEWIPALPRPRPL